MKSNRTVKMTTDRCAIAALAVGVFFLGAAMAQDQLLPFRDPNQGQWGYRRPDGSIAIPPRYLGVGVFREGQAPVKDADGFAIIDETGRILERIVVDSVSASAGSIPSPADACAWSASAPFPAAGLRCYVRQLRGSDPVVGGEITIKPLGGEGSRSAVVLKLANGVIVVEDIGYEGFKMRVLLPGVSGEQALKWRLRLYPDLPVKVGCSEVWTSGIVPGGAFIEQGAGC
jgi:hypothetical protein